MTDGSIITGGCLCGAVRYECTGAPIATGYCHCRMCQKALGAPFGAAVNFEREQVAFTAGGPLWHHSSEHVRRGFCGQCGSPIAYQRLDTGNWAIWTGTLDEPDAFRPAAHWWTGTKLHWGDVHPDLKDDTTSLSSYRVATASATKTGDVNG